MDWWKWFPRLALAPDGGGAGGSGAGGEAPTDKGEAGAGGAGEEGGGAGGSGEPKLPPFASQLSPEVRTKYGKDLESYAGKSLNDVVADLVDTRGKLSRAIIPPDPKTATPEEISALRAKIGVPEKPDGYQFSLDAYKDLEGVDDVVAVLRKEAYDMSLNGKQAQAYVENQLKRGKASIEARTAAAAEARAKFDERLAAAVNPEGKLTAEQVSAEVQKTKNLTTAFFAKTLKNADLVKDAAARGILYDPAWTRTFAAIQELLGDEKFIGGRSAGGSEGGAKKGTMGNYSAGFQERYGDTNA